MPKQASVVSTASSRSLSSEQCNAYIDTIQQALDNSLSTTGNLSPDDSVVEALAELKKSVLDVEELSSLVSPLYAMISHLESLGGTFNAADTLLVQEAVIAVTLGVDSLANDAPTPELIADVTARVVVAAEQVKRKGVLEGLDHELLDTFIEEATERLQQLYELFQRWRAAPRSGARRVASICRSLHNLKGAADSVGLVAFAALVHQLESAVEHFDSGVAVEETENFNAVAVNTIEALMDDVDGLRAGESVAEHRDLLAQLATWAVSPSPDAESSLQSKRNSDGLAPSQISPSQFQSVRQACSAVSGKLLESRMKLRQATEQCRSMNAVSARLMNLAGTGAAVQAAVSMNGTRAVQESAQLSAGLAQSLTELDQSLQSQALHLDAALQELDRANTVPLDGLKQRLQWVVEQSASAHGKLVEAEFLSDHASLPADLLAEISHPLEQLVRNAIVHGIETEAARSAKGKPLSGALTIQFLQTSEKVQVVVSDDGRGVDFAELRRAVNERFSIDQHLDDQALLSFLACPGVSTACEPAVTSGRGIGLDAVLAAVVELGGSMRVTTSSSGCQFHLDLPRRSRWEDMITVRVGDTLYAIIQSHQLSNADLPARNVALSRLLGYGDPAQNPAPDCLLTLQIENGAVELQVDEVLGFARMQMHDGGMLFQRMPGFKGITIGASNVPLPVLDIDYWVSRSGASIVGKPDKPTVLVVEDSSTMRVLIARALSTVHCECLFAHDAVEAADLLSRSQPAVVLIDIKLPRGDGRAVARELRARGGVYAQVPLVFTTSIARHVVSELLIEVAPAGYLEKPYTADEVARLVAGLLCTQALPSTL